MSAREFRALIVGTYPHKNLERVAAALQGLPIQLNIVGHLDPEQRALLDQLRIPYSQRADLSDSEMRATYQESSLLIFASTYEGYGLPILEAQACGIPVITSSIPPMCEVAGGAALLVDPFDTSAIRSGVETLLRDANLRAALVSAGARNAAAYSVPRVAASYATIYQRLLSARP